MCDGLVFALQVFTQVETLFSVWFLAAHHHTPCCPRRPTGHTSLISAVRFEPDSGHYLLTAGYDNTSRLWGGPRFRLLRTLAGHEGKVMGADISPDGSFTVATTGYDRTIKVWGSSMAGCTAPPGCMLLVTSLLANGPPGPSCLPCHCAALWARPASGD